MRTTVTLDPDVAAAVEAARRERGLGLSEAINELVRAGLTVKPPRRRFRQETVAMNLLVDVTNIGEALEVAEGPAHR